jgi:hypothetical protein
MPLVSPTLEGFRAAFRRPLITFGEITWRWAVGTTATILFFFGLFEYLDTLPVTNVELLFLRTRNPFLVSQALTHILRGSISRGLLSLILAILLLAVIWMVAASLGRLAIVEAMIDHFQERFRDDLKLADQIDEPTTAGASPTDRVFTLLRLNFLRVVVALAGLIGLAGAATIAGSFSSPTNPRPGLALVWFLPVAGVVCLIWCEMNWLLSLASVFAVRDADDVAGAISSAVTLCRERTGAVVAVSTWAGLAHVIAFVGASTVVSVPLALAGVLPWRLVAVGVILVTLAYFAVSDWVYTARLAGYVCIAELPDALLAPPAPTVIAPPSVPAATIDRDELILSDVPQPVTG